MIYVSENTSKKLSGISSLFVSFNYHPEIVAAIKKADQYSYDKTTHTWELPCSCLAYLLDNLTFLDDITLQLMSENTSAVHYKPKLTYKTQPFEHQLEAIEWGLNTDCGLLLFAPGLGKSLTAIDLALELKEQKGLEHCLIICGVNTLKANWKKEIKLHSDATYRVIGEKINSKGNISYATLKERATELYEPLDAFFYIINIEALRADEIIKAIKKSKNKIDMIVFDECHKCSTSSQQGSNLLKLTNYTWKYGLTGTLLTNSPLSAYLPLTWIGAEHATLTNFKAQYCIYGGFGGHQVVGYKNLPILKELIDTYSLRKTVDDLKNKLPPKTVIKEFVTLNDADRQFYNAIKAGIKEECDKIDLQSRNVLALTTRLRQATACPSVLTTTPPVSSKLLRATELTEDILSQGNKVVIMCTFKESVYTLAEMLKEYKPLVNTGDIKDDIISKNIDKFQTDPNCKVFIATTAKAGTGITLNAASYLIAVDTPWTYAAFEQVQDRIYRVNNTQPAFIYDLICENTVDEVVDMIVYRKKALGDYVVDDILNTEVIEILQQYIENL